MPSIHALNNFILSTGKKLKTKPDDILNEATKNSYLMRRMLKGQTAADTVQSGQSIIDRIMLRDNGTAVFYNPNEDLDVQNVDNLTAIELDWKFHANHWSYTQQEAVLNSGDAQTYYKNLVKAKRQGATTDTYNDMEEALWDTTNFAQMESNSGKVPYSIPFFVTDDGLAPSGATTIHGVNPTTESAWRNQVETYDSTDLTNPDSGLVQAFDEMFMKVRFRAPRSTAEYWEDDALQQMMIATNRRGRALYLRLTRDSNDRLVGNDLGGQQANLGYAGLPVEYVAELDNAGWADDQPKFYWLNLKYMRPVWHADEYMKEEEPLRHPRQPFSWVVWHSTYYNICCRSRRRQGIIVAS